MTELNRAKGEHALEQDELFYCVIISSRLREN